MYMYKDTVIMLQSKLHTVACVHIQFVNKFKYVLLWGLPVGFLLPWYLVLCTVESLSHFYILIYMF